MNAKKLFVSFLAVMSVLLFVITVSAGTSELVNVSSIEINGISESGGEDISVIAGEKITIEVIFESLEDASDVRIEAELKGAKVDSEAEKIVGNLEDGKVYREVLTLTIPYELEDEISDDLILDIEIFNSDFKTRLSEITLRVQRPAYNAALLLIQTNSGIKAGGTMSVDVVLKNIGYNDLEDTYVTVRVPALNLEKTDFFGDLISIEDEEDDDNDDDDDTARRRLFLEVPYDAETGIYTLEVEVTNSDLAVIRTKQIFIENEVPKTVLKSGNGLVIVNPTNNVKVYTIIPESPATVSDSVVVVPAGSSRTVTVNANTEESVSVNVLLGDKFVGSVEFTGVKESSTNLIAVLTIVLTIIFVVLVVVLLVLLTRKSEKDEEFSESYY